MKIEISEKSCLHAAKHWVEGLFEQILFRSFCVVFSLLMDEFACFLISVKTDSVQSSSNYLQKLFTKNLLTAC